MNRIYVRRCIIGKLPKCHECKTRIKGTRTNIIGKNVNKISQWEIIEDGNNKNNTMVNDESTNGIIDETRPKKFFCFRHNLTNDKNNNNDNNNNNNKNKKDKISKSLQRRLKYDICDDTVGYKQIVLTQVANGDNNSEVKEDVEDSRVIERINVPNCQIFGSVATKLDYKFSDVDIAIPTSIVS